MLDDFRIGWKEEEPKYGDNSPVLTCFRDLGLSDLTVTGIGESNAFSVVGGITLSRSVSAVFKSQQEAETAYSRVATLNFSACLADRLVGQVAVLEVDHEKKEIHYRLPDGKEGKITYHNLQNRLSEINSEIKSR